MEIIDGRCGLVKVGVNDRRALRPLSPAGLPCLLSRCHVTPPRSHQDPYGPVVSAASCYVSMIPGQRAFVVTPSGGEHSRSRTGAQGVPEDTANPRAPADPGQAHDRPPRRKTTPTAYQLSSPPARTPPHTHPDSRMESPRERDLSVAARLNPAPDAPRQSDEHP